MKQMDPETAAVFEWAHGKERNLRALLCSLHSVIWEGSRWAKCGMHQVRVLVIRIHITHAWLHLVASQLPHMIISYLP